jgi:uncharacterized protein (TIGR02588 family)
MSPKKESQPSRTTAEWVTLGVSLGIVLGLLGLLTYLSFRGGEQPVLIEVEPQLDSVREEGGRYYLPVEITNQGDATASEVQIEISLSDVQGNEHSSSFTVQFLAGGAAAKGEAIFTADPRQGELTVSSGYLEP